MRKIFLTILMNDDGWKIFHNETNAHLQIFFKQCYRKIKKINIFKLNLIEDKNFQNDLRNNEI